MQYLYQQNSGRGGEKPGKECAKQRTCVCHLENIFTIGEVQAIGTNAEWVGF